MTVPSTCAVTRSSSPTEYLHCNMHATHTHHTCNRHAAHMAAHMQHTCIIHAAHIHHTCSTHASHMQHTSNTRATNMQHTCNTHGNTNATHMHHTCNTHAAHMQHTCSTNTTYKNSARLKASRLITKMKPMLKHEIIVPKKNTTNVVGRTWMAPTRLQGLRVRQA